MRKFEYLEVSVFELRVPGDHPFDVEKLNEYGELGWELSEINGSQVLFKRELGVE